MLFEWLPHAQSSELLILIWNISIKGTIILVLAGLLALLLRRASAAARHWVWSFALLSLLVLPALSTLLPSWHMPWLPKIEFSSEQPLNLTRNADSDLLRSPSVSASNQTSHDAHLRHSETTTPTPAIDDSTSTIRNATTNARTSNGSDNSTEALIADLQTSQNFDEVGSSALPAVERIIVTDAASDLKSWPWMAMIFWIWMLGAILILARLVLGMIWVRWISRKAVTVTDASWVRLLSESRRKLRLLRAVKLWRSTHSSTPMTWGVLNPVVLLPSEADGWSDKKSRAVLLHELAHVKRKDTLTQMLAQFACALFWFNPLVWIAARQLRIEREHACDDQVLASGTRASEYASYLLDIARSLRSARVASLATIAMARQSQLEGRLLAILNPRLNRRALTPFVAVFIVIMMLFVIVPLAAIQPWSSKETASSLLNSPSPGFKPDTALIAYEDIGDAEELDQAPLPDSQLDDERLSRNAVENQFREVAEQINSLKEKFEAGPGGGINQDALQRQVDVFVETATHLLKMTTQHLNRLADRFESGQGDLGDDISLTVETLTDSYGNLMENLASLLETMEESSNSDEESAKTLQRLKYRLETELEEDLNALEQAAERLIDAVDHFVEQTLKVKLGPLGQAIGALIGNVTNEIKIEVRLQLDELIRNLEVFDKDRSPRIRIHVGPDASINLNFDKDYDFNFEHDITIDKEALDDALKDTFENVDALLKSIFGELDDDLDVLKDDLEESLEELEDETG